MKAEQQQHSEDLGVASSGSIPDTKAKPATALPWVYEMVGVSSLGGDGVDVFEIATADGYARVAEHIGGFQNADYIVRACNAYPKLVAALKKLARPVEYADTPAGLGELIAGHELLHHLGEIE